MENIKKNQKFKKLKFEISFKEASAKCDEKYSGMKLITSQRSFAGLPIHMTAQGNLNLKKVVDTALKPLLFYFNEHFKGVPVSYGNIKCLETFAKIIQDRPRMVINLQFDMVVFAPEQRHKLDAVVTKISPCSQHLSLLACNIFNVSVYKYHKKSSKKDDQKIGDQVDIGNKVRVKVVGAMCFRSTLHIKADLVKVLET